MPSPYSGLPERAFWRTAVADRHFLEVRDVAEPLPFGKHERFATAGSCFAQHISRHLKLWGANYLDLEPAPDFIPEADRRRHGFGIYSCRYGNIYTARQLLQLAQEARGKRSPEDGVWLKDDRYYDALRPAVDPEGHDTAEDVQRLRQSHLSKVRQLLREADIFVFTMGLTEAWESSADGTVYPSAPGAIAGDYDKSRYVLRNFRYNEIGDDLLQFWRLLRRRNPAARMLLTVSPVPITATASGQHVLPASTYTKCTLRAIAGDIAQDEPDIHYFPGYELISSHPGRGMFFDPNLRTINDAGVAFVLKNLAAAIGYGGAGYRSTEGLLCDEEALEKAAPNGDGA